MKNLVTFYLHWEYDSSDNVIIQNKNLDACLIKALVYKQNVKFVFIDENGISNSKLDLIVTEFVKDCQSDNKNRYNPYLNKKDYSLFPDAFKGFVTNLFKIAFKKDNMSGGKPFLVFLRKNANNYFEVNLPTQLVSKEEEERWKALGPDDLFASFSPSVIFEYILPRFYLFLFESDKLEDKTEQTNLLHYLIGLK